MAADPAAASSTLNPPSMGQHELGGYQFAYPSLTARYRQPPPDSPASPTNPPLHASPYIPPEIKKNLINFR